MTQHLAPMGANRIGMGETMPDGTVNIIEVDDVVSVQRWGEGLILRMETRDPVIVRADGTCELLVTG